MSKQEIVDCIATEQAPVLISDEFYPRESLALFNAKIKAEVRVVMQFSSVTSVSRLNLGSVLPLETRYWEIIFGEELINSNNLNLGTLDG